MEQHNFKSRKISRLSLLLHLETHREGVLYPSCTYRRHTGVFELDIRREKLCARLERRGNGHAHLCTSGVESKMIDPDPNGTHCRHMQSREKRSRPRPQSQTCPNTLYAPHGEINIGFKKVSYPLYLYIPLAHHGRFLSVKANQPAFCRIGPKYGSINLHGRIPHILNS